MKRTLWQDLRQSKPFQSLEEETFLQILLTAQVAGRWAVEALRPFSLTAAQFNVLRILRGARPSSLPAGRIAERMVHHDPDLTRLLDKLEAAGLAVKSRDEKDRRVVNVTITAEGLAVVEAASKVVRATMEAKLGPVGPKRLGDLADLLEVARATAAEAAAPAGAATPAKAAAMAKSKTAPIKRTRTTRRAK